MPAVTFRRLLTAGLLAAVLGCRDSTAPVTTYTLFTINGGPPPRQWFAIPEIIVTGGTLTLGPENRVTTVTKFMCSPNLPPGTTCHTEPEVRAEGTWDEEAGVLRFGTFAHDASVSANEVAIFYRGYGGIGLVQSVWVYRR